ncbi:hypothetical protein B0J13DRAFT_143063 [Dactylonectria estremocensis]|uniref:AAA+ ATPase domain-containing protein n=1 Tax=Dactylonectria estremocensis TaxID=1079267 RepID=A0A9P9IQZ3_9HYPO|nr:hypothetical protein B0J13DRAFT_143063 [Dactylonectria estremocensis]
MDAGTDSVLLMTSKTSLIEKAQQRYIDALEKRITALEQQADNTKQIQHASTPTSTNASSTVETPPETSAVSNRSQDTGAGTRGQHETQVYSRFFGKVKIVARRYSKDNEEKKDKPIGKEEVISDAQSADGVPDQDKTTTELEAHTHGGTIAPMVLTLGLDDDDFIIKANIRITDPELQALIQIVFAHYPGFGPDMVVTTLDSPFEPFIQYWRDLQALAKGDENHPAVLAFRKRLQRFKESGRDMTGWPKRLDDFAKSDDSLERTRENLEMLLEVIHEAVRGRAGDQSLSRILEDDSPTSQEIVNFENLWTIYKPGDIVVSRVFLDELQAFIVHESMESAMERKAFSPHWRLVCWTYDWTGKTFRRISAELRVDFFKGTRKVQSLPVFPVKYLSETEREHLEQRGRRFQQICLSNKGFRLFQYTGDAILRASGIGKVHLTRVLDNDKNTDLWQSPFDALGRLLHELIHGTDFTNTVVAEIDGAEQVVIDALSFRDYGPGKHYQHKNQLPMGSLRFWKQTKACRCSVCQENFELNESQRSHYDLEPDKIREEFSDPTQYLLCPPRVLGYHLSRKRWVELKVTEVKDIKQRVDTSAFDYLQMESVKSKELLKSLVMSHWNTKRSDNKGKMQDLMKGKGESLVILLYGPPGVGKTLTAETVALATGRPLLFVTVADIGLDPEKVEENLIDVFRLAASWEAIILFDEADVFLESRSNDTASLPRNALVSELLRVLEYYDGMLILTTNRLRRFDHAVMSRMNLAIRYPDLNDEQKKRIFLQFLGQLDEDSTTDRARIEQWIRDEDTREQLDGLNGRQIRNILFSAAKMTSEQEGGKLSLEAIKRLAQATKRFAQEIRADMEASRVKNEPSYRTM